MAKNKTLADYTREHQQLARQLADIGFIWEGSISRRHLTCGNPRCACRHDKDARHGPYVYWTTKKAGKTVSRTLDMEEAELLDEWIGNRRELKRIVEQMMAISSRAHSLALKKRQK